MTYTSSNILKQKRIGGIDDYHALGYFGKCNIMQIESSTSPHGDGVVEGIFDIAPKVTVFRTGSTIRYNNDKILQADCYYNGVQTTIEDFIRTHNIKIVTASFGGKIFSEPLSKYWQVLIDKYNLILVSSAGNHEFSLAFPANVCIAVGAVGISDNGIIKSKCYTGKDPEVDFGYFTGDQEGNSFSAPRIVGVIVLLLDRFGDKTKDEIYQMLKILSLDVDSNGFSNDSGWGVPILHQDDHRRLGKLAEQNISGTLREIDVELLPNKIKKQVKSILYGNENYIRLRDFEDVLNIADIEYNSTEKIPTIKD